MFFWDDATASAADTWCSRACASSRSKSSDDTRCFVTGDGGDDNDVGTGMAIVMALFGAIFVLVPSLIHATTKRGRALLALLLGNDGVGCVNAVIINKEITYGGEHNTASYHMYYVFQAERKNPSQGQSRFFRVNVDGGQASNVDHGTYNQLQVGMVAPVRFLEKDPRRNVLQAAAERQKAAEGECCGAGGIGLYCFLTPFWAAGFAVGLLAPLLVGTDGGEVAGPFVFLLVFGSSHFFIFRFLHDLDQPLFPCCPDCEFGACGQTTNVVDLTEQEAAMPPPQVQALMARQQPYAAMPMARLPVATLVTGHPGGGVSGAAVAPSPMEVQMAMPMTATTMPMMAMSVTATPVTATPVTATPVIATTAGAAPGTAALPMVTVPAANVVVSGPGEAPPAAAP
jgi:hypothetical protein